MFSCDANVDIVELFVVVKLFVNWTHYREIFSIYVLVKCLSKLKTIGYCYIKFRYIRYRVRVQYPLSSLCYPEASVNIIV